MKQPNFLVILIDDLRHDELGVGGHPYMKTPHADRIAHEGALFERAFHTTPICSPNRASVMTGQYASRHGIIDNVARDAASHRLPNYHLALQELGYETAHVGKWHMGNDGRPRPGYHHWVSFDGHGRLNDPTLNVNGTYEKHQGYMTDLLNQFAVDFVSRKHERPWSLFFAHKAVHPDAFQHPDGTLDLAQHGGYRVAERHEGLYQGCVFPKKPNMLSPAEVVKSKPAWAEAMALKQSAAAKAVLEAIQPGSQEEIRLRACMMAAVDEGVGALFEALERSGALDDTVIIFFGDNGYFFGEHGLGPERRFAYEEGIRSPFLVRYPRRIKAGSFARDGHLPGHRAHPDRAGARPAGAADPGPLAVAALFRAEDRMAEVVPHRVLGRERHALARGYDLQGRADRPSQVHSLGQQEPRPRAGRALRSRHRSVRASQFDPEPIARRGSREAAQGSRAARGGGSGHLVSPSANSYWR